MRFLLGFLFGASYSGNRAFRVAFLLIILFLAFCALSDVKTSWAQRAGYPTVSSGSLIVDLSEDFQFGKRSGQEAVKQRRPSRSAPVVSVEHGRANGLWRMLSYALRSKTGGGRGGWADVARRLPATAQVLAL